MIRADDVLRATSDYTGVPKAILKDGSRGFLYVCEARRLLWAALIAEGWSYPAIADYCNGRHHSSIWHGLHKAPADAKEVRIVCEMAREGR